MHNAFQWNAAAPEASGSSEKNREGRRSAISMTFFIHVGSLPKHMSHTHKPTAELCTESESTVGIATEFDLMLLLDCPGVMASSLPSSVDFY